MGRDSDSPSATVTLSQHLVDKHGLRRSRPDATSSRKRKSSDEAEFLECAPEHRLCSLKRSRFIISTIDPRLLLGPTPAGYHVNRIECLTDLDSSETPLDGRDTGGVKSPQLKVTDTGSAEDNLFFKFVCVPSPSCLSIGEVSGCSSDTAIDPIINKAVLTPSAELLFGRRITTSVELTDNLTLPLNQSVLDFEER